MRKIRGRTAEAFMSAELILGIMGIIVILFLLRGEILCIYKAVNCNWEPVGKAEVVYTIGVFTGLGGIIGWIDIEDK